jgi:hypothetical protein
MHCWWIFDFETDYIYLFHFQVHHSNIIRMLDIKKENVVTILMEKVMFLHLFQNNEGCQKIHFYSWARPFYRII